MDQSRATTHHFEEEMVMYRKAFANFAPHIAHMTNIDA